MNARLLKMKKARQKSREFREDSLRSLARNLGARFAVGDGPANFVAYRPRHERRAVR